MKPPEDIKKGLECCIMDIGCEKCPYDGDPAPVCYDEGRRDALAYIQKLESSRWELFDDLSTAYYGKQMYGLNDDGTVYSRYSCDMMSF